MPTLNHPKFDNVYRLDGLVAPNQPAKPKPWRDMNKEERAAVSAALREHLSKMQVNYLPPERKYALVTSWPATETDTISRFVSRHLLSGDSRVATFAMPRARSRENLRDYIIDVLKNTQAKNYYDHDRWICKAVKAALPKVNVVRLRAERMSK